MISRRLIRIKVLQTFYSYRLEGCKSVSEAEKQLFESIDRVYGLFFYLTSLLIEIFDFARWKLEQGKYKLLPTEEDLNPNTKFIDNQIIQQLRENLQYNEGIKKIAYKWNDEADRELVKRLYEQIKKSDFYKEYMANEQRSYQEDKKMLLFIIEKILLYNEDINDNLEEKSIFWADSVDYGWVVLHKVISKYSIGDDMRKSLFVKFRSDEDSIFARELLTKSLMRQAQYIQILEDHIANWDISRLAQTDIIILVLALHEILYFEEVPVKVTMDEYIEIAKHYSTAKSPAFINGILDKIVKKFREENLITKTGKGLIE